MTITQTELDTFTGSEEIYRHFLGICYTQGVKYLANKAQAYWLLDAIASHQTKQLLSQPALRDFQLWQLTVSSDKSAVLICQEDSDTEPVVKQEIEYTDFPLGFVKLYLIQKVLLLPSEY